MNKRRKKLDKGAEARRLARKIGPKPGATQVVVDKRKKPQKHKAKLADVAEEYPLVSSKGPTGPSF